MEENINTDTLQNIESLEITFARECMKKLIEGDCYGEIWEIRLREFLSLDKGMLLLATIKSSKPDDYLISAVTKFVKNFSNSNFYPYVIKDYNTNEYHAIILLDSIISDDERLERVLKFHHSMLQGNPDSHSSVIASVEQSIDEISAEYWVRLLDEIENGKAKILDPTSNFDDPYEHQKFELVRLRNDNRLNYHYLKYRMSVHLIYEMYD